MKQSQDNRFCNLHVQTIIDKFQLKVLLVQLDHEKLPVSKARDVLFQLYNNPVFLPAILMSVARGLYLAVRHIEAICIDTLKMAGMQDANLQKMAKTIL